MRQTKCLRPVDASAARALSAKKTVIRTIAHLIRVPIDAENMPPETAL